MDPSADLSAGGSCDSHQSFSSWVSFDSLTLDVTRHSARMVTRAGFCLTEWVVGGHHCYLVASNGGRIGWAPSLFPTVLFASAVVGVLGAVKLSLTTAEAVVVIPLY